LSYFNGRIYNLPRNGVKPVLKGPLIFALDTSSKLTSMCLARGPELVATSGARLDRRRSEKLWTDIESLFKVAEVTIKDVDLFAVCSGPGGFTGLRVGMAAMKGLSAASNKPIVGVTSLEAAAMAARPAPLICAMVGTYKGEVFWQLFSSDRRGLPLARSQAAVGQPDVLLEQIAEFEEVVFAGDGACEYAEKIMNRAGARRWSIRPIGALLVDRIAELALLKFQSGEVESAEAIKAFYVRSSDAEIKLAQGLVGRGFGLGADSP
jgi:tRNA threonylcarbamoyl adenosine modification protein YeaZ